MSDLSKRALPDEGLRLVRTHKFRDEDGRWTWEVYEVTVRAVGKITGEGQLHGRRTYYTSDGREFAVQLEAAEHEASLTKQRRMFNVGRGSGNQG